MKSNIPTALLQVIFVLLLLGTVAENGQRGLSNHGSRCEEAQFEMETN